MKRFRDWDVRLMDCANSVRGKPFIWGETNCTALAAACMDAMTGSNIFDMQKGLELDEKKARKLSADRFVRSVLIDNGYEPIERPELIQRGDIVLVYEDPWECTHVVLGRYALTSSPENGVFLVRTRKLMELAENPEVFRCRQ